MCLYMNVWSAKKKELKSKYCLYVRVSACSRKIKNKNESVCYTDLLILFHFLQISSICGNVTVLPEELCRCVINASDTSKFSLLLLLLLFFSFYCWLTGWLYHSSWQDLNYKYNINYISWNFGYVSLVFLLVWPFTSSWSNG